MLSPMDQTGCASVHSSGEPSAEEARQSTPQGSHDWPADQSSAQVTGS